MPTPRILVLRAPGTNCDRETAFAFEQAGGIAEIFHVNRFLENARLAADYQILCIPGGFSFGDDIAAGRILGNLIRHHLNDALTEFKAAGKLVLGICNGFQVLIKSGILLADDAHGQPATLTLNDSGRYEDRWVRLATSGTKCVFLQGIAAMYLPVAHAEGKFVARDALALSALEQAGQLALRYVTGQGLAIAFPENPNGSQASVAGVCDETGRVFGLMPHPERHIDPTHHPRWTRQPLHGPGDGLRIFQNAVGYFTP
jgi:phosphoribosylformylglycinamidine synthase